MTINIETTNSRNVLIEYIADEGGAASCTLVGADKADVEDRAEEFVEIHNFKENARE